MSLIGVEIEAEMRCTCGQSPHVKTCDYYFKPMTKTLKDITQEWDVKFDEKFNIAYVHDKGWAFLKEEVKEFMRNRDLALLEAQRAEVVERVRKLEKFELVTKKNKLGHTRRTENVILRGDILILLTTSPSR